MRIGIIGAPRLDERARVLDSWLHDVLSDDWARIKDQWGLIGSPCEIGHAQAWRFFLPAMYSARRLARRAAPADVFEVKSSLSRAPVLSGRVGCLISIDPHEALRDDLKGAWHPSLEGLQVEVVSPVDRESAHANIRAALDLLMCASPPSFDLVSGYCGAISFVAPDQPARQGFCVSTTSKSIPGLVYLSAVPTILSAESLVHESAHLKLGLHELDCSLFVDPKHLVRTPLRPDPRPVSGLLHQVWVLVHLQELYQDLLRDSSEIVRINFFKIRDRLSAHSRDLVEGLRVIHTARDSFTEDGWRFVEALVQRAETMCRAD